MLRAGGGQVWCDVMLEGGIAADTLLVGADAAVVQAAIMGGLSLFARQIDHRQDGSNSSG